ncbi:DUF397 domain-containing protein [Streptomyces sp. 6N223]|uniref:DUF397 domain-containing protein n=1 Tax=Streptomyces sp. 6N223 TaxID=3457412 RepID=UPI003FCF9DAB
MPPAAAQPDLSNAVWRASSYSNGQGGDCLQIADQVPGPIPIRDSKNPTGPALFFPAPAWSGFLTALATGGLT